MVEHPALQFIRRFRLISTVLLVVVVAITVTFLMSRPKSAQAGHAQGTNAMGSFAGIDTQWLSGSVPGTTPSAIATPVVRGAAPVVVSPIAVTATPASAVVAAVVPAVVAQPSVAQLVAQVEATGVNPGSNWTWSMGNTATHCGAISGAGTGCTYGAGGLEFTVFSGSPTLALVAHELANAETQNDAIPSLLSQVSVAEAGSSWSPTDAVASCLVAHFMGFQDDAAGSWQCPAALATVVANNIHDTL
jgi:hypothetical protein